MTSIEKCYEILGVEIDADLDQVKKAYRQLAKKYHPDYADQNPQPQREAEAKFQEITNAYDHIKAHLENNDSTKTNIFVDRNVNNQESKADLFYRLGALGAEDEDWQEAIFYFTKAIKVDPDFLNAYYYRAAVLEKQGFQIRANADLATAENIKYRKENISFSNSYKDNMVVRKGRKYQRPSPRQRHVNNYHQPISKQNTSLYQWQILIPVLLILSFAFAVARLGNDSQNNNRNSSQINTYEVLLFRCT